MTKSGLRTGAFVAVLLLVGNMAFAVNSHAADPRQFADFPVTGIYEGKAASFDESTTPGNWAAVRLIDKEIISEEMAKGPNFAGAYYLATVGCGSGCEAIFVIGLRDGHIYGSPVAGTNGVVFQKDSRLIIVREDKAYNLPRIYLVFENGEFRTIEETTTGTNR